MCFQPIQNPQYISPNITKILRYLYNSTPRISTECKHLKHQLLNIERNELISGFCTQVFNYSK